MALESSLWLRNAIGKRAVVAMRLFLHVQSIVNDHEERKFNSKETIDSHQRQPRETMERRRMLN